MICLPISKMNILKKITYKRKNNTLKIPVNHQKIQMQNKKPVASTSSKNMSSTGQKLDRRKRSRLLMPEIRITHNIIHKADTIKTILHYSLIWRTTLISCMIRLCKLVSAALWLSQINQYWKQEFLQCLVNRGMLEIMRTTLKHFKIGLKAWTQQLQSQEQILKIITLIIVLPTMIHI